MVASTKDFLALPLLIHFILLISAHAEYNEKCHPSIHFLGYTRPRGDIYVEHGNALDINCTVNDIHKYTQFTPSSQLYFTIGNDKVDDQYIQVINETTIRLFNRHPAKQSVLYNCKLNTTEIVCLNKVIVGTKPSEVKNFRCISENWDNLTCTWTREKNPARVDYVLSYKVKPFRSSRTSINACPKEEYSEDTVKCFWSGQTEPLYRSSRNELVFTINATNYFGSTISTYDIMHFENVRSGRPTYVNVTNIGTNSVHLVWGVPQTMQVFPDYLKHRIMVLCTYDKVKEWKTSYVYSLEKPEVAFELNNLENAHDRCDIRIAIKVNVSHSDDMWSSNSSLIVLTQSTIPAMPPKTPIGSFQLVNSGSKIDYRDAYVYWIQIPENYKNAKDFSYNISIVSGRDGNERMVELNNAYARFVNLNKDRDYIFRVFSQNANGSSLESSYLTIPKDGDRAPEPRVYTKTVYPNDIYALSWNGTGVVDNYTIFWCLTDRDRPVQCKGNLNSTVVSNRITSYNVTVPEEDGKGKVTQFAIAANGPTGSSGMVWISCTHIYSVAQGKIRKVIVNKVSARSIELMWKIDCEDGFDHITSFVIYYCSTLKLKSHCDGPQQNKTIYDGDATVTTINGLTPYTTYKFTIAAVTVRNASSEQSEPLYNTTLEDAPSKVEFIKETFVGPNSIVVEWNAPGTTNGVITEYKSTLKGPNNEFHNCSYPPKSHNKCPFNNLIAYTNYTFEVQACTTSCSAPATRKITTKIAKPPKIHQPIIQIDGDTYILSWKTPQPLNGPLKYYEVNISREQNEDIHLKQENDRVILSPYCSSEEDVLHITLRVVTYNNEGKDYMGDVSDVPFNCKQTSQVLKWIWIILSLFLIIVLGLIMQKFYNRCKQMTDVQVKLPAGLQLPPVKDGFASWNSPNSPDEPPRKNPPADEEHLLEKLSDGRVSGDSSGCSSGHDSVSSLESANAPSSSSSDSGTEQPPSPVESNSVRQRKAKPITVSKPYVTVDAMSNWKPPPQVPAAGNYCVLGVNPIASQNEPESSTYVPIIQAVPSPNKSIVACPSVNVNGQHWPAKSPPTTGNYCVLGLNPETTTTSKGYVSADAFTSK